MLVALLVLALAGDSPAGSPSAEEMATYRAARATAGRDANAHVKLALWCEAHGLNPEKVEHLAIAVTADPANAVARGLMGMVKDGGAWVRPDGVGERIQKDKDLSDKLAEYKSKRAELQDRFEPKGNGARFSRAAAAKAHARLGAWCEKSGLQAEATAHYTSAVVLAPQEDANWKHLGYVRHEGRWMSREQLAAAREEAEAQRKADARWEPLLREWRARQNDKDAARKDEAIAKLAGVSDSRAVPSIMKVFANPAESDQMLAVQLLGQIDSPASTKALAQLAVFSGSEAVRSAAMGSLRHREPRDYAGMLVEMIRTPTTYEIKPVGGPGDPGGLLVDTPRFRMLRHYDAPKVYNDAGNAIVGYDVNGLPIISSQHEFRNLLNTRPEQRPVALFQLEQKTAQMIAAANLKAEASQQRLMADVYAIETANAAAIERNRWAISTLSGTLDAPEQLGNDQDAWSKWWYDRLGYRYEPPPKMVLEVDASPELPPPPTIVSCFAAGTPVRTLDGHRPIEGLSVGDRVLTQDTATGELSFQPILVVHRNPPGSTVRITLDNGETVVASRFHRFWRAGRGWAMARELEKGDELRTLAGRSRITGLSEGAPEPVFNLDVAKTRTFFVGQHDALVHDNTLPDSRARAFDAGQPLESSRPAK